MATAVALEAIAGEGEHELGAEACPTADFVRELLTEARAAIAAHGADSGQAVEATRRLEAAQEARMLALSNLSDDEVAAMRRRAVEDHNRRLAAFRAEAAAASAGACRELYASLRQRAATLASSAGPRTERRAREHHSTRTRRARPPSSGDDPSPSRPPRERLCEWPGCEQPVASKRKDARYCSKHRERAKSKAHRDRERAKREARRADRFTAEINELLDAAAASTSVRSFGGHRIGRPTLEQIEHARRVDGILVRLLGGIPRSRRAT